MSSQQFTYSGPAPLASVFAQMLKETGLRVAWSPPVEERGLSDVPQQVVVNLLTIGSTAAVIAGGKAAMKKFRERFPGAARIDSEDPYEDDREQD